MPSSRLLKSNRRTSGLGPYPIILILARSGSLSIRDKNLARGPKVAGISLLERAVVTSLRSNFASLGDVYVYSDDHETLEVTNELGAVGVRRPEDLSLPEQSSESVVANFLLHEELPFVADPVCLVQLTSPFLREVDLDRALEIYELPEFDSAVAATRFTRFLGLGGESNIWEQLYPKGRPRRQDMAKVWMETGMFYLAERAAWLRGSRFGEAPGIVEIDEPHRCLEIDEPDDLKAARALARTFDAGTWVQERRSR